MTGERGDRRPRRLAAVAISVGAVVASVAVGSGTTHAAAAAHAFTPPTYLKTIGKAGDALVYPWGMATETYPSSPYYGDIIVGDYNNYDVKVLSPITATTPGRLVATISQRGSKLGSLGQPYGIAIDPNDGSIYVADENNVRVDKFSDAGVFEYAITPAFAYYMDYVAVNASGDVFISQSAVTHPTGKNEIFEYSNTGTAITTYVGSTGPIALRHSSATSEGSTSTKTVSST